MVLAESPVSSVTSGIRKTLIAVPHEAAFVSMRMDESREQLLKEVLTLSAKDEQLLEDMLVFRSKKTGRDYASAALCVSESGQPGEYVEVC